MLRFSQFGLVSKKPVPEKDGLSMTRIGLLVVSILGCCVGPTVATDRTETRQANPAVGEFVMWDYRDVGDSGTTLSEYHWWLSQTWLAEPGNRPERFILYVTSPSDGTEYDVFYKPSASIIQNPTTDNLNFVTFLKQISDLNASAGPGVNAIQIEVMVDSSSFASATVSQCSASDFNCNGPFALPAGYFSEAPCLMDWLSTLTQTLNDQNLMPVLGGLTIDPEHKLNSSLSSKLNYMSLALWIDHYVNASSNQLLEGLRYAMTFGVTSKNLGSYMTARFPMTAASWTNGLYTVASGDTAGQLLLNNLDSGTKNLCWRPTETAPLLDTVYMQVYAGCSDINSGNIWQWMNTVDGATGNCGIKGSVYTPRAPADAAKRLGQLLRRTPQTEGPGTVSIAQDPGAGNETKVIISFDGAATVKSRGTESAQVTDVPIWQVLASSTHLSSGVFGQPLVPPNIDCNPGVGWTLIAPASSGGTVTGTGHRLGATLTDAAYLFTETPIYYPFPGVQDAAMAGRFVFLFSAEVAEFENCYGNPFFGHWTFSEFSAFATELIAETNARPFFGQGDPANPCAHPLTQSQLGIFDLRFACAKWGLDSYPGYSSGKPALCPPPPGGTSCCPYTSFDVDSDGVVGGVELATLLSEWGSCPSDTECWGDFNQDGLVDAADLQMLFGFWGAL